MYIIKNQMTYTRKPRHYFNNIQYTTVPFFLVLFLWSIMIIGLTWNPMYYYYLIHNESFYYPKDVSYDTFFIFMIKFNYMLFYCKLIIPIGFLINEIQEWAFKVIIESSVGRYTKKLKSALVLGFFLFLLSEIMLFGAIFCSYFTYIFQISVDLFNLSQPSGLELLRWYQTPIKASIILITSGYTYNYAFYSYRINNRVNYYYYSRLTMFLGFYFLVIQLSEYKEITFSMSDSVYGSIFFFITGFHGFHVLVGLLFISFMSWYINAIHSDNNIENIIYKPDMFRFLPAPVVNRATGIGLSLIYWHFVDIIWLFVVFFLYYLNNEDFIYLVVSGDLITTATKGY